MNKDLYEIVISEIDVYFGDGDCIEPCDKKACAARIVEVLEKVGYRKADASFERYLLDKLLKSGCDCCSICAHTPPNELCESENVEDCYCGIREFYEKFVEGK